MTQQWVTEYHLPTSLLSTAMIITSEPPGSLILNASFTVWRASKEQWKRYLHPCAENGFSYHISSSYKADLALFEN